MAPRKGKVKKKAEEAETKAQGRRDAESAVEACVRENSTDIEYFPSSKQLRLKWKGKKVIWHAISDYGFQVDAIQELGSVDHFARHIHPKASAKMILNALKDLARDAALGEGPDSPLGEEAEAERLIRALLFSKIEVIKEYGSGEQVKSVRVPTTLASEAAQAMDQKPRGAERWDDPDHPPATRLQELHIAQAYGIGLIRAPVGDKIFLIANLATAVGLLHFDPDFSRRSGCALSRILHGSSRLVSDRFQGLGCLGRWFRIDVTDILIDPKADDSGEAPTEEGPPDRNKTLASLFD